MYIIWSVKREISKGNTQRKCKDFRDLEEIQKLNQNISELLVMELMEIWLPRVTTQPLLNLTREFLSSSFFLMTRRKQKVMRLVKYNPTLQRSLWSQKREPASMPFPSAILENYRPEDTNAWRVAGHLLAGQEHKVKGESEKPFSLWWCLFSTFDTS